MVPPSLDLREGFKNGLNETHNFFQSIPEEKWTIKEILQHLVDTERIFMHRCFRIARRDTSTMASFNQEIYIMPSGANEKSSRQLLLEYEVEREHSIIFLNSISDDDLSFIGDIAGQPMSARAAAFLVIGHDIWHLNIIRDRYLLQVNSEE